MILIFSFSRFNDEVKHIKVIEKDSWIHITEAKKFESLLVSQFLLNACVSAPLHQANQKPVLFCFFLASSSFTNPTGAGGVLPVPFTQRKLQALRHNVALPLQVERAFANSGQYALTR